MDHLFPNTQLPEKEKILNFTITRFETLTSNLKKELLEDLDETCRWSISPEYLQEALDETNLGYTITFPESFYQQHLSRDKIASFILASHHDNIGFIYIICNMSFFSDRLYETTGSGEVPFRFGFLLHCYVLREFRNLGIAEVYLDASNLDLVKYYTMLGYRLGKEPCGDKDPITDLHEVFLTEPEKVIPKDYVTPAGYRMKLCHNFETLCTIADKSLERVLELVDKYQLDDFYTTA